MAMGAEWLTTAATFCLLSFSWGGESVLGARVGGSAELGCGLSPDPGQDYTPLHVLEWLRQDDSVPILIKFGPYAPRVHPDYEGRVSVVQGSALRVEGLRLGDEGWFQCRILLLDETTQESQNSTWTFLSVTAPPVFVETPPPFIEVLQGDSLVLSCRAHANPPPVITWKKDDVTVGTQGESLGVLSFPAVTRETAGTYTCHVSHTEGNLTQRTQLRVKGPPVILIPPENTSFNMSQDGLLRCLAESYPPNMTYVWQKQGVNVYHTDLLKSRVKIMVDGTLHISALTPEDTGNYTCIPTNGLLTPPTASAYLTVNHPAQVWQMPRETYLPVGLGGVISCPLKADPPLLYVGWTKDGKPLNLDKFPGWRLDSNGSLLIARVNDNTVGVYTCTPYNSYGTMGQSESTTVVLQDPPTFKESPQEKYLRKVGGEVIIPCQANGSPPINITWKKVGSTPHSMYSVAANGSLILQVLSKDHQGAWECIATNHVGSVSKITLVSVLGTTPHAVSSVSVVPGINQANVSWVPGFDGGHSQQFTVWLKQISTAGQEWTSLAVKPSSTSLLVFGLLPSTTYQFSILPQNQVGSGPFSQIATVRTLDPPPIEAKVAELSPPTSLSVNQTSSGFVLQWLPPSLASSPITGFILQARCEEGEWLVLDGAISANATKMLVQGFMQDCLSELRLLSRRDGQISEPSLSVSLSTRGIEARNHFLELVPNPLFASLLGAVGLLCGITFFLLGAACVFRRTRKRRRRKRREGLQLLLQQCPPTDGSSSTDSPDSAVKMKVFPASPTSLHSSVDKTSCSEFHNQHQLFLSSPPPHYTLEPISRGPDGRFVLPPPEEAEKGPKRRGGEILTVDLPSTSQAWFSLSRVRASYAGPASLQLRDGPAQSGSGSEREREGSLNPLANVAGALAMQMEHEREQGHLSRCLELAWERKELEEELEQCTASLGVRPWQKGVVGVDERGGEERWAGQKGVVGVDERGGEERWAGQKGVVGVDERGGEERWAGQKGVVGVDERGGEERWAGQKGVVGVDERGGEERWAGQKGVVGVDERGGEERWAGQKGVVGVDERGGEERWAGQKGVVGVDERGGEERWAGQKGVVGVDERGGEERWAGQKGVVGVDERGGEERWAGQKGVVGVDERGGEERWAGQKGVVGVDERGGEERWAGQKGVVGVDERGGENNEREERWAWQKGVVGVDERGGENEEREERWAGQKGVVGVDERAPIWELRDGKLPENRNHAATLAGSSPPCVIWEVGPVTSVTSLVPVQSSSVRQLPSQHRSQHPLPMCLNHKNRCNDSVNQRDVDELARQLLVTDCGSETGREAVCTDLHPCPQQSIQEYLSLPGFLEMSVDEPVDRSDSAGDREPTVEQSRFSGPGGCEGENNSGLEERWPELHINSQSSLKRSPSYRSKTVTEQGSLEKAISHPTGRTCRPSGSESGLGLASPRTLPCIGRLESASKQTRQQNTDLGPPQHHPSRLGTPPVSQLGSPEAFLPRGPSKPVLELRACREGTEERGSYASQSSGRGSLEPSDTPPGQPQHLSVIPPLESGSPWGELEVGRSHTRRHASVDESYEWDSADFCPEDDLKAVGDRSIKKASGRRGRPRKGAESNTPVLINGRGQFPQDDPTLTTGSVGPPNPAFSDVWCPQDYRLINPASDIASF